MSSQKTPQERNEKGFGQITRRGFIRIVQCAGIGALLGWKLHGKGPGIQGTPNPASGGHLISSRQRLHGRLVHVLDTDATSWDFSTGWYGYYVDQAKVDTMTEVGLKRLTGAGTAAAAWGRLLPDYVPGQKFAIKVNFNNFNHGGPDPDPDIGALIEPVNALIRTMIMFGVQPSDISVYDVTDGWHTGSMPQVSFINRCLYPGVSFVYSYGNPNPFSSTEKIVFNETGSPNIPDLAIGTVLVEADYLINMFVPKAHALAGVTLGFKNHLGSFQSCEKVHNYLPYSYYYDPNYSTLVDIMRNRHFAPKTVLTVCDGLFGNWVGVNGTPKRWITFGNDAPNSLFFSADPVAIDAVLTDYIEAERIQQGQGSLINGTRDFLSLAEAEGMGVFDTADPWTLPIGSDYQKLKYIFVLGV